MADESMFNFKKQLALAVLGPAVVCLIAFLLVRVLKLGPPVFEFAPETGENLEFEGDRPELETSLEEALFPEDPPGGVEELTTSDLTLEDLSVVLHAAAPSRSVLEGALQPAPMQAYLLLRETPYFYVREEAALGKLVVDGASETDGASEAEDEVDLTTSREALGLPPAPVVLVFCTPPLPGDFEGSSEFSPTPQRWIEAAEIQQRARLAARSRGLIAVSHFECRRRALAAKLGLKEEQQILTLLLLSAK